MEITITAKEKGARATITFDVGGRVLKASSKGRGSAGLLLRLIARASGMIRDLALA